MIPGTASLTARRLRVLRPLSVLAALLIPAATAQADQERRPVWEFGLGAAVLSMPHYRGSDERQGYVFPAPYLIYRGDVLRIDRERVRGLLFSSERMELDVSLSGSAPVNSRDNRAREGMPDLDPTLELGPQLRLRFFDTRKYRLQVHFPWRFVIRVDRGDFLHTGWLFNPILNFDIRDTGPDGGWDLGVSGGPLWANSVYHGYFYGVDDQFATPERPGFRARGGYSGAQVTLALSKRYSKIWVGGFVRVNDLHGAVVDGSPLLKSETSWMSGLSVCWVFAQSERTVLSDD